jgi:argininosuccinate lyase
MKNIIKKAEKNTDTVMPGLTHLKMHNLFHSHITYCHTMRC